MNKEVNIAIIQAKWHSDLTTLLTEDCIEVLNNYYLHKNTRLNIFHYKVPGSAELPITAALVSNSITVDAIVCIGVLLKGESDHYTFISNQVSYGIQKVAISFKVPVISGVLTCQSYNIAKARVNGEHSKSGKDFAMATIEMINIVYSIKNREHYNNIED